jgi:hypothetical protein
MRLIFRGILATTSQIRISYDQPCVEAAEHYLVPPDNNGQCDEYALDDILSLAISKRCNWRQHAENAVVRAGLSKNFP